MSDIVERLRRIAKELPISIVVGEVTVNVLLIT